MITANIPAPRFKLSTFADASAKLRKAGTENGRPIVAAVLHLAPANLSGHEVCGGRTKGCTAGCLNSAGRGGIGATFTAAGQLVTANTIQSARIRRTRELFTDQAGFMARLVADLEKLVAHARKVDGVPAFRPNGTSDLDWSVIPCVRNGRQFANMFEAFPEIRFWDYTKIRARIGQYFAGALPDNYAITFSRAETLVNKVAAMDALRGGMNVAVVFSTKKGERLPDVWNGHVVIDGDVTDFRFTDPKGGYVVGLRSKGKAKRDTSGFVVPV